MKLNASGNRRGLHGRHARGEQHPRWNGGRYITSKGYVAVRVQPDHPHAWGHGKCTYAYEHILVMEAKLGRKIRRDELVHHRNERKTDNRPDNLEVKPWAEHSSMHALSRWEQARLERAERARRRGE